MRQRMPNATFGSLTGFSRNFLRILRKKKALIMSAFLIFTQIMPVLPAVVYAASTPTQVGSSASLDPVANKADRLQSQGSTGVDQSSGAFTYSYPIKLPAGRNGMAPTLTASYNSQNNESTLLGYGWNLSIPYIERVNKGGSDKLYYDQAFVSSLHGELVTSNGTSYEQKVDDGSYANYTYNQTSWQMVDRDGNTYYFGDSASSRVQNDAGTKVGRWYLTAVRDKFGNSVTYSYIKDSNSVYPSAISYTENALAHTPYVVSFTYGNKPDQTTSYKYQFKITDTKRLTNITVKALGTDIAYIDFGYTTGSNGVRSLLSIVEERRLGDNGDWTVLPKTTFAYENSPVSFSGTILNSSNPMGSSVIIDTDNNGINEVYSAGDGYFPIDINGDFHKDLAFSDRLYGSSASNVKVKFNYNQNGSFNLRNLVNSSTPYSITFLTGEPMPPLRAQVDPAPSMSNQNMIADVNGDGFEDIIYKDFEGGSGTAINTTLDTFDYSKPSNFTIDISSDQLADINGDGLLDKISKVYTSTSTLYQVHLNTGSGYATTTNFQYDAKVASSTSSNFDPGVRFVDVNNDGLIDAVRSYTSDYADIGICGNTYQAAPTRPINGSVNEVYINNGTAFVASSSSLQGYVVKYTGCPNGSGYNLISQGTKEYDSNGDLTTDYDSSTNQTKKQDVLTKVTTSLGSSMDIGYKWSTSSSTNPSLPIPINTVASTTERLTLLDPSPHMVSYTFASGTVYFDSSIPKDHKIAGFGRVDVVDGNQKTVTYLHQGNGDDPSTGETGDSYYAIGKPYRTDVYDVSSSTNLILLSKSLSLYKTYSNASSTFTYLDSQVSNVYTSTSTWVSSATHQIYDVNSRLITTSVDYGEIDPFTSFASSTISDTGTDVVTTTYQYSNKRPQRLVRQISTDFSGNKLSDVTYYYDNLPYGLVDKGAQTSLLTNVYNNDGTFNSSSTQSFVYDASGNPTQTTDALGRTTLITYDSNYLFPVTKVDAFNGTTTYTYNPITLNLASVTYPDGISHYQEADGFGNIVHTYDKSAGGGITNEVKISYLYGNGLTVYTSRVGDSGITSRSAKSYDSYGRLIQKKDEITTDNYITQDTRYDARGNVIGVSVSYTSTGFGLTGISSKSTDVTYTYDAINRPATKTDNGYVATYSYSGRSLTVSDNSSTQHKKTYTYDARGNLAQVIEYNGSTPYTTTYGYTPTNKLSNITDADGNIRNFTYLSNGLLSYQEDPHASTDTTYTTYSYTYDALGKLLTKTGPLGTITYSYDNIDRPTGRTAHDSTNGTSTVTISYTGCSNTYTNPCTIDRGTSSTTLAYNSFGKLQSETLNLDGRTYTRSYTYDLFQNPLTVTYPDGGKAVYTYTLDGRQSSLSYVTPGNVTKQIVTGTQWTDRGEMSSLAFGNGVYQCNTYTASSTDGAISPHLSKSEYLFNVYGCSSGTANAVSLYKDEISYKDTFTPSSILSTYKDIAGTNHTKQDTFTFDNLARSTMLSTSYDGGAAVNKTLSYDPIGNLLQEDNVLYSYSADGMQNVNAATSIGGTHIGYDSQGNRLQIGDDSYSWNILNQLLVASTTNGTESYTYDENGERIKKVVSANKLINQKVTPATATSSTYGFSQGNFLSQTANSSTSTVSTTSIVAYYKMDGNSSDSVGSNSGSDTSVTYSSSDGKINSGAAFNGTNSQIALSTMGEASSDNITWGGWVKLSSKSADRPIFADNNGGSGWGFLLRYNSNSDKFEARIASPSSGDTGALSSTSPTTGTWYHVVAVWQNGTSLKLYINGTLETTTTTSNSGIRSSTNPARIGAFAGSYMQGSLDELFFYKRALSSSEVSSLYNTAQGIQYPFLAAYAYYVASSTYNTLSALSLGTTDVKNLVSTYYSSPFVSEYCKTATTTAARQTCTASTTEQLVANDIVNRSGTTTTTGFVNDLVQITKGAYTVPSNSAVYSATSSLYTVVSSATSTYGINSSLISSYNTYIATGIVTPVSTYSNLPLVSTSTFTSLSSLGLADTGKVVTLFSLAGCTATSTQCVTPSKVIFEKYYKNNGTLLSDRALSEMWYVFAGKARVPYSSNEYSTTTTKYLTGYTTTTISGLNTTTSTSTYYSGLYFNTEYTSQTTQKPELIYFNTIPYYVTLTAFTNLQSAKITQATIDNYNAIIRNLLPTITTASSTEYMLALKQFAYYDKGITLSDSDLKELYLDTIGAAIIPPNLASYTTNATFDLTSYLTIQTAYGPANGSPTNTASGCNGGLYLTGIARCIITTSSFSLPVSSSTAVSYILSVIAPSPSETILNAGESTNPRAQVDTSNYPAQLTSIYASRYSPATDIGNYDYISGTISSDKFTQNIDVTSTVVKEQASSTSAYILLMNHSGWISGINYAYQSATTTLTAYANTPQITLASTSLTSFATTTIATSTDSYIKDTISAYFGEVYDSYSQNLPYIGIVNNSATSSASYTCDSIYGLNSGSTYPWDCISGIGQAVGGGSYSDYTGEVQLTMPAGFVTGTSSAYLYYLSISPSVSSYSTLTGTSTISLCVYSSAGYNSLRCENNPYFVSTASGTVNSTIDLDITSIVQSHGAGPFTFYIGNRQINGSTDGIRPLSSTSGTAQVKRVLYSQNQNRVTMISPEAYAEFASTTLITENDIGKIFAATTTPQCVSNASSTECDKQARITFFRNTVGSLSGFIPSSEATEEFWMIYKRILRLPSSSDEYNLVGTTTYTQVIATSTMKTFNYNGNQPNLDSGNLSTSTPSSGCTTAIAYDNYTSSGTNKKCFFSLPSNLISQNLPFASSTLYVPTVATTSTYGPNNADISQMHAAILNAENYYPSSGVTTPSQTALNTKTSDRTGYTAYEATNLVKNIQNGTNSLSTIAYYFDLLNPQTCNGSGCFFWLSVDATGPAILVSTIDTSNPNVLPRAFNRSNLSLSTSTATTSINLAAVPAGLLSDTQFRSTYSTSTFALAATTTPVSQDTYNELLNTPIRTDSDVATIFNYALPYATSSCPGQAATSSCVITAEKTTVKNTIGTLSGFNLSDAALEELYRVNNGTLTIVNIDTSSFQLSTSTQTIIAPLAASTTYVTYATSSGVFTQTPGVCTFGTTSTSSRCYIAAPLLSSPTTKILLSYDFATSSIATSTILSTLTIGTTTSTSTLTGSMASTTVTFDVTTPYQTYLASSTVSTSTALIFSPNDIASSTLYTVNNPKLTITRIIGTPQIAYDTPLAAIAFSRASISSYATSTGTTTVDLTTNYGLTFSTQFVSPFGTPISITTSTTTAPLVATSSMFGYWKLDGNSNDSTGAHNGSDTSMSYATAKINQGGSFSGSGYIQLSDVSLGISTGYSISAWIKTTNVSNVPMIMNRDAWPGTRFFQFYINTSGQVGFIRFDSSANVVTNLLETAVAVNDGNWHHVVATFNNASGSVIYVDNVSRASDSVTTNNKDGTGITPVIGAGHNGNPNIQNYFIGSIDEVGLWTRGLSSTEVSSLYNSGSGVQYPFTISTTTPAVSSFIANPSSNNPGIVTYDTLPSVATTSSPASVSYPFATSSLATSTINTLTVATTTSYTLYSPFSDYQQDSRGTVTTYLTLNGQVVGTYTYQTGQEASTGKINYILTNYLGTPVMATDDHGDIVEMDITDVFGNYVHRDARKDNAEHTRGFTNQDFDDVTGLNYFHARYLDTKAHTFLSVDPVIYGLASGDSKLKDRYLRNPQEQNSYAYALNNPIIFTDPTGLFNLKTGEVEKGDTLSDIVKLLNKTNGTNYSVSTLQNLNSSIIKDVNKIYVGQILIPNQKVPDITSSLTSTMQANAKDTSINSPVFGPTNFKEKVQTGGVWDFKNDKNSPYYANNGKDAYVFNGMKVGKDAPGNINYGYVGYSTWWGGEGLLLRGAGAYQIYSNARSRDQDVHFYSTLGNIPYFDNPGDTEQIRIGIDYRKAGN